METTESMLSLHARIAGSEPTYEGWKRGSCRQVSSSSVRVPSLPMRDGNKLMRFVEVGLWVGSEPTYEGWKQGLLVVRL